MSGTSDRDREARAVLDGVRRDTESLGSSSFARIARRAGDHFSAHDAIGDGEAGETDRIELWGRRIGRMLSAALFVALAGWLGMQLGWW